ncbi:MAG: hypothetical protein IV090_19420 [Candidatus Sericytochromatia bacterium]|nr:hypothetical protein [Candidatus Sericytochromatia bacterium]
MTHAGKIPQTLLGLLLLGNMISCTQSPTHPENTGKISFRLAFPNAQTGFALKAIPAGSRSYEIHISGTGLTEAKIVKISATPGETQKNHTVGELPVGPKQVRVTAFDENKALATASKEVTIVASQTTREEFDLRSALFALEVKLPRTVPLDIPVQAKVTGENILNSGLALSSRFAAGSSSLTLSDLPEGKKQLVLSVQFKLNNQTLTSEAINKEVTGKAGETAQIEISLNEIANALIPTLLKQNLADLPNLLNQIPPELVELLRSNALLAAFLNNRPSPVPTAQPTPQPSPTQSVTPSPSPSPENQELKLEILDGRVVLRGLTVKELTMKDPGENLISLADPEVRKLEPNADLEVRLNRQIHAAVIRLDYNGPDTPEVTLKVENLDIPNAPINSREFPSAKTVKGLAPNRFNALALFLQEDLTAPTLDTLSRYKITVIAKANGKLLMTKAVFHVNVVKNPILANIASALQ